MTDFFSKIDPDVTPEAGTLTPFAGLLPVAKMFHVLGLPEVIDRNLAARSAKGYKDSEQILALVLMQLAGGEAPEHLNLFREKFSLKDCPIQIPSPTSARAYAACFHNAEEDVERGMGRSFIPEENACLAGFEKVHAHVLHQAHRLDPKTHITLDQDATFIPTETKGMLFNYNGERSCEAFNTYCPEHDILVGTQFRDGNVHPGWEQLDQLKKALANIPIGVEKVSLRSDSAGYQVELLKYCACGENERFGVMDFAISCPVTKEFKKAAHAVKESEWKPLLKKAVPGSAKDPEPTGQEWAEVVYVPDSLSHSRRAPDYRFLAIREKFDGRADEEKPEKQMLIPALIEEIEQANEALKKLHLTEMNGTVYKIFGLVTNLTDEDGGEIIRWHRGRCGKSEEIHRLLKNELAGGHVISRRFGANAMWWNTAVLALSLHNLFKRHFLPDGCRSSRPKTLLYGFYTQVGWIVRHARRLILRICEGRASELFIYAWERLKKLSLQRE